MKANLNYSLLLFLSFVGTTEAANVTQIDRYVTMENKPIAAQINPLLTIQQVHFPSTVQTVGEAINYWLRYSGFALITEKEQSATTQTMLKQALPLVIRDLGPISIQEGLEILIGKNVFTVISNPLSRQINFLLKPQYNNKKKEVFHD